jgi:uncharacterized protein (TIGR02284 family)
MDNSTTLNDLIEINNDRVAGYEKASTQVKDAELQNTFNEMATQSRQFANELSQHVRVDGEDPSDGTTARGKIYRTWMDVKAAFSGNDKKTVLKSCEFGEDAAQRAYESALSERDLTPGVRQLIQQQKTFLRSSHDKIKNLRDNEMPI